MKRRVREIIEEEEEINYKKRMGSIESFVFCNLETLSF